MIQDIEPKKLNNQYANVPVSEDDAVFVFRNGDVLISRGSAQQGAQRLAIPTRDMFPDLHDADFRYLFEISGERFFLYQDDAPREKDQAASEQDDADAIAYALPALDDFAFESVRQLRQVVSKDVCFAAMTAYHLHTWYRDNRFCGRCGTPFRHSEEERALVCPACDNVQYPKIAPAVIVGLHDGDRLLLTKYANRAYSRYALIAGYTEIGETPEQTVAREVLEEVGLKVRNVTYYKSQPWGFDGNLLLGFFAELDGPDTVRLDENELACATWFERDRIPVENDHISLTREMIEAFRTSLWRKHESQDSPATHL